MNNLVWAFLLTSIAGLSTGIGSLIALIAKKTNTKFLSVSLGFSAGVMIYVSLVEILDKARISLIASSGEITGQWFTLLSFFAGILLIAAIDQFVPKAENPHEMHTIEEMDGTEEHRKAHRPRAAAHAAGPPHAGAHLRSGGGRIRAGRLAHCGGRLHT